MNFVKPSHGAMIAECQCGPDMLTDFSADLQARAALTWLAAFHAFSWERKRPAGLWEEGCYWYLRTRCRRKHQLVPVNPRVFPYAVVVTVISNPGAAVA